MEAEQLLNVFRVEISAVRRGEGMMTGGNSPIICWFKKREFGDPYRVKGVFGNQPQASCQMEAKLPSADMTVV